MRISFIHLGRENLGIEYLSAVLKKAGHETSLSLDPGLFGLNDNVLYIPFLERLFEQRERILEEVGRFEPQLIAFSVYTTTYQWACQLASLLKQRMEVPIAFGGMHATLVPEEVIKNEFVDFVVVGEGEYALLELVESLGAGKTDYNIKNVWFKRGGEVIKNSLRPPLREIDSLPFPDKELFEKDINYHDDYLILTNRGCIFNCSYCCESFMNELYHKKFFRRRSVNSVMEELKFMKARYHFREVMFNDSVFFTDKKWLKELMREFKREIGVPFRCFGQVNYLDEEVGELLREGGCYAVEFGMQTLNESIKRNVLNRSETNERARKAFTICDRLRLRYDIDHMFGLPGESEDDHLAAAGFYSRLKYLNRLKCHNLTYFPKLPIGEIAKREMVVDEGILQKNERGEVNDFFHSDSIKDKELQKAKDNFQVLFKLLPLLPAAWIDFILRRRWYRPLRFIPSPVVMLLQLLVAIKGRDYRYIVYLKYYPLRIKRSLRKRG